MVGMIMKKQSSQTQWWWFDNQSKSNSTRSSWLQSTLSELDHKTEAMRKLVEADADSFAQRAEMYYKKRPELIGMVEEFYRAHRSLAEKYHQLKSESGTRVLTTLCSPFKYGSEKSYDYSGSEICDGEDSAESEVDDPEEEDEEECVTPLREEPREARIPSSIGFGELRKLREEIERLEEENRAQREQLKHKDEEKREVIRHLSLAVDMLKDENVKLRKSLAKDTSPKKTTQVRLNMVKDGLFGRWFGWSEYPVVAL